MKQIELFIQVDKKTSLRYSLSVTSFFNVVKRFQEKHGRSVGRWKAQSGAGIYAKRGERVSRFLDVDPLRRAVDHQKSVYIKFLQNFRWHHLRQISDCAARYFL